MAARITLTAQVAALTAAQAQQGEAILALTGTLTTLVQGLTTGQFFTPTLVQDTATQAPAKAAGKAKKGARKGATAQATAPKVADPVKDAEKAQAWALVKADREALSPLIKALSALGCKGEAWAGRFGDDVLVAQALKALTPAQRKAAKEALARKAAKNA